MIVRSGLALTIPVLFSSGAPDGGVLAWRVLDGNGDVLASKTAAVAPEDVSVNLLIDPVYNTLPPTSLIDSRDVDWTYAVDGSIINGEERYSVEARAPYGASNDGVRAKLGVEKKDLPDSDVSLIRAFIGFRDSATPALLAAVTSDAGRLAIRDAIEAQAALSLIPTMAVRVAVSEDSGTNSYKRQAVDWDAIAAYLAGLVDDALTAINPVYNSLPTGSLFILATPSNDPITGGAYG